MLILPIFILNEDWSDWIKEEITADNSTASDHGSTAGQRLKTAVGRPAGGCVWHRSSGTAQSKVMERGPGKHKRLTDSGFWNL